MNTLVRANVVAYRRRYAAVIAAITIGVAFLTATLFVGSSIRATLSASVGQAYQNAQFAVKPSYTLTEKKPTAAELVKQVAQAPGVKTVLSVKNDFGSITLGSHKDTAFISGTEGNLDLFGTRLTEGAAPGPGEVAVSASAAAKADVKVGSTIQLTTSTADGKEITTALKVSGLRVDSQDPTAGGFVNVQVAGETATKLGMVGLPDLILADLTPGTSASSLAPDILSWLTAQGFYEPEAGSPSELVTSQISQLSGGVDALTAVLLAFAGIALVVTVLVVANTFAVILAQRTRELALLRTLGARRGQIRKMVTGEALVVGLVGGLLGIIIGGGVVALGALIVREAFALPYVSFGFDWMPLLVGIVVGLIVTIAASARPALAATRVSPLAALRPSETVTVRSKAGTTRVVIGLLLVLSGTAALLYGVADHGPGSESFTTTFGMAFLGGLVSFIGVLVLGTLLIPWAVRQLARPFGAKISGRLAGLNALRHPQRTAAIGTALLLGVTLVSMMLAGATSARATINAELGRQYPVDLVMRGNDSEPLKADSIEAVNRVAGVKVIAQLDMVGLTPACKTDSSAPFSEDDPLDTNCAVAYSSSQDALEKVMTQGAKVPALGSVALGEYVATSNDAKPSTIELTDGTGRTVKVPVDPEAAAPASSILMTTETRAKLGLPAEMSAKAIAASGIVTGPQLWVRSDDTVSASTLMTNIATAAGVSNAQLDGALPIRQMASQIIDTLLMVVSALLAVAVVIALIGVSNTLSLSVIERTRENSLLRALGLTKRQLRSMLALEAALIAGASALLGMVLGTLYGLAGARAATAQMGGGFAAEIPWLWLAVVLVVAVGAAILASVFPARRAARLSPVEGLAVE